MCTRECFSAYSYQYQLFLIDIMHLYDKWKQMDTDSYLILTSLKLAELHFVWSSTRC
jgi:hypothetical protein